MKPVLHTIETRCPKCLSPCRVDTRLSGQSVSCPKCRQTFTAQPPAPVSAYPVLGRLALSYRFIGEEDLTAALAFQEAQTREGVQPPLASVLLARRLLTARQVALLEAAQKFLEERELDKRFGRLAVARGFASAEAVAAALAEQAREFSANHLSRPLGELLMAVGVLTGQERDLILAEQQRPVDGPPDPKEISDAVASLAPQTDRPTGPQLTVDPDGLSAHLSLGAAGAQAVSLEAIKTLLAESGVVAGVVADEAIAAFLGKSASVGARLEVAVGRPPAAGRDAEVRYFFETDFRRVGAVTPQGTMDYRDRGEIPHVKSGELIAEKRPAAPGIAGEDVYGRPIAAPQAQDARLRCGRGVRVADNGSRFYALNDGQPQVTVTGKLTVASELTIPGDVDLKVGHLDFDGSIRVAGTIREGFNVTGAGLSAMEICGANVKITGDVTVTGGIIGARISVQGDLKARYIKNSSVSAFGNVFVEKEIIDSAIETSGACKVLKGAMVASEISARYGIEALDVGTDASRPCTLRAGSEQHIQREIGGLRDAIARAKEHLAALLAQEAALAPAYQENHRQITELAQIQDRAMLTQRELGEELLRLRSDRDASAVEAKGHAIADLEARARRAEAALGALFEQQEQIEARRSVLQTAICAVETEIQDFCDEREAILAWSRKRPGVPVVVVGGEIFAGTRIYGVHASAVLKADYRAVQIREIKRIDPQAGERWELRIQPSGG
ncbi:MAG: flagellar assembly protein A [Desulfobacterales bacterium]